MSKKRNWYCLTLVVALAGLFVLYSTQKAHNIKRSVISGNTYKYFPKQWALKNTGQKVKNSIGIKGVDLNVLPIWQYTKGDQDIKVAIIDSGIDTQNKGIANIFSGTTNNTYQPKNGWNFYNNNNIIFESYLHDYHGTYLCSTIVNKHDKDMVLGIAPQVDIIPVKFLNGTKGNEEKAIKAIEYACKKGANIINCSWNFNEYNKKMYDIIKKNSDVLFVCAAGNSNLNLDKNPIYPACYKLDNVLTVMAIDNKGKPYEASGYGEAVDVAAPGVDIITTFPENDIGYISGTSIATANVTGVAALLLSLNKEFKGKDIANLLKNNCHKLDSLKYKCLSEGTIDAFKCYNSIK